MGPRSPCGQEGEGLRARLAGTHGRHSLSPRCPTASCLTPHTLSHLPGSPSRQRDRGDPVHPPGPAVQCLQQPPWDLALRGNPGEKERGGVEEEGPHSLPPPPKCLHREGFQAGWQNCSPRSLYIPGDTPKLQRTPQISRGFVLTVGPGGPGGPSPPFKPGGPCRRAEKMVRKDPPPLSQDRKRPCPNLGQH